VSSSSFSPPLQSTITHYLPYFLEIRKRLLFIAAVFLAAAIFGFAYYQHIITIIFKIFKLSGVNIVFTSPFQFIDLAINSALLTGTAATFPLMISQFLAFIRPALKVKEYKLIKSLIPFSLLLFAMGTSIGLMIMRYIVVLFYQKSLELNIGNFLDISLILSQTLLTALLMGIAFQIPIVITILMSLKIVSYEAVARQRIPAYVLSLVFAALLPPTDLLSLLLLTLPLVILFEITLILNKTIFKKLHRR